MADVLPLLDPKPRSAAFAMPKRCVKRGHKKGNKMEVLTTSIKGHPVEIQFGMESHLLTLDNAKSLVESLLDAIDHFDVEWWPRITQHPADRAEDGPKPCDIRGHCRVPVSCQFQIFGYRNMCAAPIIINCSHLERTTSACG